MVPPLNIGLKYYLHDPLQKRRAFKTKHRRRSAVKWIHRGPETGDSSYDFVPFIS
jgi:hypothetical protein